MADPLDPAVAVPLIPGLPVLASLARAAGNGELKVLLEDGTSRDMHAGVLMECALKTAEEDRALAPPRALAAPLSQATAVIVIRPDQVRKKP